ncbi:surface-adhesin E family protein [Megalodesulfovibrio paquesii]
MTTVARLVLHGCLSLVLGGLLLAAPAWAQQEWAPFGMSQNGDAITLDRRSITKQGGNAAFTMRVDFNTPAAVNGKEARSLEARIEINCEKSTYRRVSETFKDAGGAAVSTITGADWMPIPPSSFGEALRNFCK